MFGYLSLLIEMGFFKKIDCCFLMVGHTHGSIDQKFSVFSKKIKKGTKFIGSRLALHDLLLHAYDSKEAHKNPSICRQIQIVYDVKKMLDPYINHNIKYFQFPHVFTFTAVGGKAIMQYKMFSNHDEWLPKKPQNFDFNQPSLEAIALEEITKKNKEQFLRNNKLESNISSALMSASTTEKLQTVAQVLWYQFLL